MSPRAKYRGSLNLFALFSYSQHSVLRDSTDFRSHMLNVTLKISIFYKNNSSNVDDIDMLRMNNFGDEVSINLKVCISLPMPCMFGLFMYFWVIHIAYTSVGLCSIQEAKDGVDFYTMEMWIIERMDLQERV